MLGFMLFRAYIAVQYAAISVKCAIDDFSVALETMFKPNCHESKEPDEEYDDSFDDESDYDNDEE